MEPTGALGNLAGAVVRLLVQAAGAALMVVLGWQCLRIMLSGGNDRLLREVAVRVLVLALALGAMSNLSATAGLVQALGGALWGGVVETAQSAL
jgi:hypothetical protein